MREEWPPSPPLRGTTNCIAVYFSCCGGTCYLYSSSDATASHNSRDSATGSHTAAFTTAGSSGKCSGSCWALGPSIAVSPLQPALAALPSMPAVPQPQPPFTTGVTAWPPDHIAYGFYSTNTLAGPGYSTCVPRMAYHSAHASVAPSFSAQASTSGYFPAQAQMGQTPTADISVALQNVSRQLAALPDALVQALAARPTSGRPELATQAGAAAVNIAASAATESPKVAAPAQTPVPLKAITFQAAGSRAATASATMLSASPAPVAESRQSVTRMPQSRPWTLPDCKVTVRPKHAKQFW